MKYEIDSEVPFWRNNIDVDALFENHAHRPDRAQAWLRYWHMSETSFAQRAVMMRGRFVGGCLGSHTFHYTFTPTFEGELAVVIPVYEQHRLVDLLAISRTDQRENAWGCCTGFGNYIGQFVDAKHDRQSPVTLLVHQSPASWLLSGKGVLPLRKSFFPMLQLANQIVAQDGDHAWEIAHRTFIDPAMSLGLDCAAAEQIALDRISFDEVPA